MDKKKTRAEIWLHCLKVMKANFQKSFTLTDDDADIWFDLLADVPDALLVAAVAHVCKDTEAFPSVASIRKAAKELMPPLQDGLPTAEQAWEMACRWVSESPVTYAAGRIVHATPPHPAVAEAVKLFGRDGIRERSTDTEGVVRAQFRRVYEGIARKEEARGEAGLPSLLASGEQPAPLQLGPGGETTKELEEQNAEARRHFAEVARKRREEVSKEIANKAPKLPPPKNPDGTLNFQAVKEFIQSVGSSVGKKMSSLPPPPPTETEQEELDDYY